MAIAIWRRRQSTRNNLKPVFGSSVELGHELAQGLVALYLLNEDAGAPVDALGVQGAATVSVATSPTWDQNLIGSGFRSLTGGGDYHFSKLSGRNLPTAVAAAFTLEALCSLTSVAQGAHLWGFGSDPSAVPASGSRRQILAYPNNSILYWQQDFNFPTGINFRADGTLQHLFITTDGATIRLYVDGFQQASSSVPSQVTAGTDIWAMGFNSGVGSNSFTGFLHKAAIYNRLLSTAEVSQLTERPYEYVITASTKRFLLPAGVAFNPASGFPWIAPADTIVPKTEVVAY